MNESSWKRLHRIAEARRSRLGISRSGLKSMGGPSSETMRALPLREGAPSIRQRASLAELDGPLGWPEGTAWGLVAQDRSDWSEDMLTDEEDALVNGPSLSPAENDLRNFGTMMLARLRAMSDEDAKAAMTQIARIVGIG